MTSPLEPELKKRFIEIQRDELTEHVVYQRLAEHTRDVENRTILTRLADDELRHYQVWKSFTETEVKARRLRVNAFILVTRLFGLTFGLKLMERGEERAQDVYRDLSAVSPELAQIEMEEKEHERQLIDIINEERLKYVSSVVLGLNDALVELTGALAGFTFALQDARLVGMTGLITGIAASLSMGTSEYLSTKSEVGEKDPFKASTYTTMAYLMAVFTLILPFVLLDNTYLALVLSIVNAILILLVFTFYISVAKDLPFKRRFAEAATIGLGVAALTFLIGVLVRILFGIEV